MVNQPCSHVSIQLINFLLGSFFLFPSLGSGSNSVSIYAENRINVERSIRLLNYLVIIVLSFKKKNINNFDRLQVYMKPHLISSSLSRLIHLSIVHLVAQQKNLQASSVNYLNLLVQMFYLNLTLIN